MIKKKAGRKSKRPTREQFENMYKVMSAEELGKHYGVATSTIYLWATEFRKEEKGGGKIKKSLYAV